MNLAKISLLSEAAASVVHVAPYAFDDSLTFSECVSVVVAELSEAAVEMDLDYTYGEEVLIESAMFESEKFDALNEGIAKSFFASVKEFFTKMKQFVVGLIEKVKKQFALNTKNKSKFVELIKKELNSKLSRDKEDFQYTGYAWDKGFLANPAMKLAELGSAVESHFAEFGAALSKTKKVEDIVKAYKGADERNYSVDSFKQVLEGKIGGKGENIIEDTIKAVKGEKKDIKKFSEISESEMLTFIEKSDDLIKDKITDALTTVKDKMDNIITTFNDLESLDLSAELEKLKDTDGGKERTDAIDAIAKFKAKIQANKQTAQYGVSFLSTYAGKVESLANEASKEFMRVLKSYALTKPAKK
jgi:hypothetical protein